VESEDPNAVPDGLSAPHCPSGTIERGEDTIAGGVDPSPSVPLQLARHHGVVLIEQLSPASVAEANSLLGRGDDVREQDGGECPITLSGSRHTRDEAQDMVDYFVDPLAEEPVVLAR